MSALFARSCCPTVNRRTGGELRAENNERVDCGMDEVRVRYEREEETE